MRKTPLFLLLMSLLPVALFGLSACFAQRLELDDPLGLPLNRPDLAVRIASEQSPEMARQLQRELVSLLPRERHVVAHAAGDPKARTDGWQLQAVLEYRHEKLRLPLPLLDSLNATARVDVELRLSATLTPPKGDPHQPWRWENVQRGEARPDAEKQLTNELLRMLRDRLILDMQPKYVYR